MLESHRREPLLLGRADLRRNCTPVRLLVALEVAFYREGISRALGSSDLVEVVGVASTAWEVAGAVDRGAPEVVLLDVGLEPGIRVAKELCGRRPAPRVLPLTTDESDESVLAWAQAGVAGYVTADTSLTELVESVRRVALGEGVCSPRGVATLLRLVSGGAGTRLSHPTSERLTRRELEIVDLLERGLSNKEIAARLHLSVPTVKNHVHRILDKLHVRRRGEAGAWAREVAAEHGRVPVAGAVAVVE
jgi:DNA-binding NarL/FixJ family response regulator